MGCGGTPGSITVTMTPYSSKITGTPNYFRLVEAIDFSKVRIVPDAVRDVRETA